MFTTILIANRGEIACRIIRTAKAMGIKTVAIYSECDHNSLHVQMADSAFCVGKAPAKDSYLNIEAIIAVAKQAKVQAIHPGYGFLSENPKFVSACEQAGIVFIGPPVAAMEAMASKQLSKQLLEKTAVPLTPGYHGSEQSEKALLKEAKRIGFPVLIKAANGGGGKGMRAVHQEADFSTALAGAKREAMASFADETMILEKLVLNPRHVEVQIMADNFANVVALFERDCSIQRRHQKIIEEAPAPFLKEAVRSQLAEAACAVARSINYRGAGTVEFLLADSNTFYFMEMNTRLQVEHPVTEMITGLDLVAWQLLIAAGQALPLQQEQIQAQGHALECRIYAEDPSNDFMPSIGAIQYYQPPQGEGIRIDSGVTQSSQISMYYDPMIAKLIAYGQDREEALQRMQQALAHFYIAGVKTNIRFLQSICQHPHFIKGKLSTNFLDSHKINILKPNFELAVVMAAAVDYLQTYAAVSDPVFKESFSWHAADGLNTWTWRYSIDSQLYTVQIQPQDAQSFTVQLTHQHMVTAHIEDTILRIESNQQHYQAVINNQPKQLLIFTDQGLVTIMRYTWDNPHEETNSSKAQLTAPMPATVVAVLKKVGEKVQKGEPLLVLEAMKMEHTIHAPTDGIIAAVLYKIGAQVQEGAELLSLEEPEKP